MAVETRLNEQNDTYELGDEIEGHWIVFATIPGPAVRTNAENQQAVADAANAGGNQPTS